MLHFNVNVSMLWRDLPFVQRFQKAVDAGFDAVEFLWPRGEDLDAITAEIQRLHLRVVLHNMDGGDIAKGERGYANDPQRVAEWRRNCQSALQLAQRVGCTRLNCLVGNDLGTLPREAQLAQIVANMQWALPHAQQHGVDLYVEPLNLFDTPTHLLGHTADGLDLLQRIGSPHAKLQYDVYHMQRMEGHTADTIRQQIAAIGHIQIADDPGRHEPGTGAIRWREVFGAIEASGYTGSIGLEYLAATTPEASFAWLPVGQRSACALSALNL